jgi:hypothetical protein
MGLGGIRCSGLRLPVVNDGPNIAGARKGREQPCLGFKGGSRRALFPPSPAFPLGRILHRLWRKRAVSPLAKPRQGLQPLAGG